MGILKKLIFSVIIVSILTANFAFAGNNKLDAQLLSEVVGQINEPKNFKFVFNIPDEQIQNIQRENIEVFVFPKDISKNQRTASKYRAEGLLLWQQGKTVFVDVRKPPTQISGGKHSVLLRIKNNNKIIQQAVLSKHVIYEHTGVDVVLVIDSSLSMAKNDPDKLRIEAARAFVDTASRDKRISRVGVVGFDTVAVQHCPLSEIKDPANIYTALTKIKSRGQTNIGKALETALRMLDRDQIKNRSAIVLLTDGKNESVAYADEHLEFAGRKIPVYCIGLSDKADNQLLNKIAKDTGAKAFRASEDKELVSIYLQIASEIGRREIIMQRKIVKGHNNFSLPIDATVKNISMILDADKNNAKFEIIGPGQRPQIIESNRKGYREIRITAPKAGMWQLKINNTSSRNLSFTVSADTGMYLDAFPQVYTNGELWLGGTFADGVRPVAGARVRLLGVGGAPEVELFDDGMHEDGAEGDGVYSGCVKLKSNKEFPINLQAIGKNEYTYMRQVREGTFVPGGEYKIADSFKIKGNLEFGKILPGDKIEGNLSIEYNGVEEKLLYKAKKFNSENGKSFKSRVSLHCKKLQSGSNKVKVFIDIPEDAANGDYTGDIYFAAAGMKRKIHTSFTVVQPELKSSVNKIDLGVIQYGQEVKRKLDLSYSGNVGLAFTPMNNEKMFRVVSDTNKLKPSIVNEVTVTLALSKAFESGKHISTLTLKAGESFKKIPMTFTIPVSGASFASSMPVHELSPFESIPQSILVFDELVGPAGELLPEIEEIKSPVLLTKKKIDLREVIKTESNSGSINAANDIEEERFQIACIISIVAIGIAVILLIIRRMSKKRITRFALMSVALHLPLVAFLVGYVMVAGEAVEVKQKAKPMIATAVGTTQNPGFDSKAVEADTIPKAKVPELLKLERLSELDSNNNLVAVEPKKNSRRKSIPRADFKKMPTRENVDLRGTKISRIQEDITKRTLQNNNLPQAKKVEADPEDLIQKMELPQTSEIAINEQQNKNSVTKIEVENKEVSAVLEKVSISKTSPVISKLISNNDKQRLKVTSSMTRVRAKNNRRQKNIKVQDNPAPKEDIALIELDNEKSLKNSNVSVSEAGASIELEKEIITSPKQSESFSKKSITRNDDSFNKHETLTVDKLEITAREGGILRDRDGVRSNLNQAPELKLVKEDISKNIAEAKSINAYEIVEKKELGLSAKDLAQKEFTKKQTSRVIVDEISIKDNITTKKSIIVKRDSDIKVEPQLYIRDNKRKTNAPITPKFVTEKIKQRNGASVHELSKKEITERSRFGVNNGDLYALLPPEGGVRKVEAPQIDLKHKFTRLKINRIKMPIKRIDKTNNNNTGVSVISNIGKIAINIGASSINARDLIAKVSSQLPIEVAKIDLSADVLSSYQLLVVDGNYKLTSEEEAALSDYLNAGGKVWIMNGEVPFLCKEMGAIENISANHELFKSIYQIDQNHVTAESLSINNQVVLYATKGKNNSEMAANLLNSYFGSYNANIKFELNTGIVWQNFSGIDAATLSWKRLGWGNMVRSALAPDGQGGEALRLQISPGNDDIAGIGYNITKGEGEELDLSEVLAISVDVYNASKRQTSLALAFTTKSEDNAWDEFESKPVSLKAGWTRGLKIPLSSLRSRKNVNEGYAASIKGADACARISVYLRGVKNGGNFLIDNISLYK